MILTNTFGSRKRRIIENKMIDRFAEINITAGKLAKEAVIRSGKKSFDRWKFTSTKFYLYLRSRK